MSIYENPYTDILDTLGNIHPSTRFGKNVKIGRGVIIDQGCLIGNNVFIGHNTVIRSGVILGDNTVIGHLCMIEADTVIKSHVTIQSQCHITKNAVIEDHVFFGPNATTSNTNRIVHGRSIPLITIGPTIGWAARIGAGALLLPGVRIGKNAQVGAGSIVTKDVPDQQIWIGNPAKYHREVPEEELL